MNYTTSSAIVFEKVVSNKDQVKKLYDLLCGRIHNISHELPPLYRDHKKFVKDHPYRAWFLIKNNDKYVGSIYILRSNFIGISILNDDAKVFKQALNFIVKSYKPLKEIKSLRPAAFHINLPPKNHKFISTLEGIGATKIQITYSLSLASI
jgi:hypothetical protein